MGTPFYTQQWYDEQLARQNRCCAVCNQPAEKTRKGRLCVDHDHVGGALRGLLCLNCNAALGMLKDDPTVARWAAAYLRAAQERGDSPVGGDWARTRSKQPLRASRYEIRRLEWQQGGRCAICRETPTRALFKDHDHSTGALRGLLCGGCNAGIGLLKDRPERCEAAATYLETYGLPTLHREVRRLLAQALWTT